MNCAAATLSLNLLVLRAENPERLCEFYAALGLKFVREQHGNGPIHHASEVGGSVLEIYPLRAGEATTTGARLGFNVPSIDAALSALDHKHGRVLSDPKPTPRGRRAVLCDPEGHKVELVELRQDAA